MKRFLAALIAIMMLVSFSACSAPAAPVEANDPAAPAAPAAPANAQEPAAAAEKKILRFGDSMSHVENLDIWLTSYLQVFQLNDLIFDRLVDKDPETLDVKPSLLTQLPTISEDGLTYSFELKQGIKFHDGSDLTTEDVAFTFNRMFNGNSAAVMAWALDTIQGNAEMLSGAATELSGLTVIDDYHFTITLTKPFTAFVNVLASSFVPILPSDACQAAGSDWGVGTVIGSGPFKVEYFEPGVQLDLVRNEDYFGTAPAVDGITLLNMDGNTALLEWEAGNIDICSLGTDMVPIYEESFPDNIKSTSFVGGEWLSFNMKQAPLDDVNVRKALCLATDRSLIADGYFNGNVAVSTGILPAGMPGHMEDAGYAYDIEAAKQVLIDAGYPNGVTVTASCVDGGSSAPVFQILKEEWAKANINLEIELLDSAAWTEQRSSGNMQIYFADWFADYIDPDMFMYLFYHSTNATFLSTGNEDEWYDSQVEAGRSLPNEQKAEFYNALDRYLCAEQFACCPMFYSKGYLLVSDRVDGVFFKPDYLISFINATIAD